LSTDKIHNRGIGSRLKFLRKEVLKKTQNEMAEELGITQGAWGFLENDKRKITPEKIKQLVLKYKIRSDWLVLGKGDVFDYNAIGDDDQWKRLLIIKNRTRIFHGTTRVAAQILQVDIDAYENWEMGLEPIPEKIIDQIYAMVQTYVRKEWWYEGKGEIFLETDRIEQSFVNEEQASYSIQNREKLETDICNFLNEMIRLDSREDRQVFAKTIKIKLREVGLFTQKD